jgi:hypothetical protein
MCVQLLQSILSIVLSYDPLVIQILVYCKAYRRWYKWLLSAVAQNNIGIELHK